MNETETEEVENVPPRDRVYRGKASETSLTEKQAGAHWLKETGYSTAAIAAELDIGESSVYTHQNSAESNIDKATKTYHEFVQPREVTMLPQFADRMVAEQIWDGIREGDQEYRVAQLVGMNDYQGTSDHEFEQVPWGLWAELVMMPEGEPFSPAALIVHQGREVATVMLIEKKFLHEFVREWLAPPEREIGWMPGYCTNHDFWAVTGLFRDDTDWVVDDTDLELVSLFADDEYKDPTDETYMQPGGRAMLDEERADSMGRGKRFMLYEPTEMERENIEDSEYDLSEEDYDRVVSSEATRVR